MRSKLLLGAALVILALDGGGCASKTAKAKDDDEYVTLPPATGSFMPRRVKKSDLANAASGSDNVATVSGTALSQSYLVMPKAGATAPGGGTGN